MRRWRCYVAGAALWLTLTLAAPGGVSAYHETTVHLEPRVWAPELSAEVQSSRDFLVGDVITERDLDLDDPVVPGGVLTLRLLRHTLRVEGLVVSSEGDTRVNRTVTFAGETFSVDSRVLSEFDARVLAVDYGFDLVHEGPFALALTLGARFIDADATLRAPDEGVAGAASLRAIVPAVGVALVVHPVPAPPLSSLALTLRASGLSIGDRGTYYDVEGAVEWLPLLTVAVRVGYRFVHGDGEEGADRAEFDLAGPYVGVTLGF